MNAPLHHLGRVAIIMGTLSVVAGAASAQDSVTWRHGIIEPKSDAGLIYMASKRGFDEKEGVRVEVLPIKSDFIGLETLIAGELDSFEGAPGGAIAAAAHGVDVKIVGCAGPQLVHGIFARSDIKDAAATAICVGLSSGRRHRRAARAGHRPLP